MNKLYVKPAKENQIVRMPERGGKPMPAYGAAVDNNSYWVRRINDVSVVQTTKAEIEKGEAAAQRAEELAKAESQTIAKPATKKGDK